ncbi:hypothetical protein V5O48_017788 [Marasmius crinis-equi]|uniref:Uncharacterized protein n=1 Tax=Marasmius crinis-equi TaxID=585013 RepID=A0ABR3EN02_9AGAR
MSQTNLLFWSLNPGTAIKVYGTIHPQKTRVPQVTFTLDSSQNETPFNPTPNNDTQYDQLFFKSDSLSATTQHSLTITFLDPDNRLWLDYIDFMPTTSTDSPGQASTNTSTTPTQTASGVNTDTKNHISKGLVAGISVLASVLACAIVLGLVWWCRRRKRQDSDSVEQAPLSLTIPSPPVAVSQRHVEPYLYSPSMISSSVPPISSDYSSGSESGKAAHMAHQIPISPSSPRSDTSVGPIQLPQESSAPFGLHDPPPTYER